MSNKKPEITVFAGPNGSGKTTITQESPHMVQPYINADDIKRTIHCSDLEAAQKAEELRLKYLNDGQSFSFETVLSTNRNMDLLKSAKNKGYFIRGIYVLTDDAELNIIRIDTRQKNGGHAVPPDKVRSRYIKSLTNIPEFVALCDVCHIYDNTGQEPKRIFKKKREDFYWWSTQIWTQSRISKLVGFPVV
jgi:predicted ABC-type ATPase